MKKTLLFAAALFGFISAGADNVMIQTPNTTMVIKADKGQELRQAYYGDRISDAEASQLAEAGIDLKDITIFAKQDAEFYNCKGVKKENVNIHIQ